jgi:hypothetical protein
MEIPKSIQLQRQIMENSKSINEYIKDFDNWVNEMNTKDNIITQIKKNQPEQPPITASYEEDENEKKNKVEQAHKEAMLNKYKRDKNSIKDYYDNWDKVDADAELVDVDSGISINSNSNYVKELYNEKKKSNAHSNISVSIKNSRDQFKNPNSQVEKLKNEANINFAIQNYNKSIELYTYAMGLMPKGDKSQLTINLYNNRGNCQIKMQNHKMGIQDFSKVLEIDNNNIKALYRRGICYNNTDKYNLAFQDLNQAFKLSKTEKEKEMIKSEMDKTIENINKLIQRERGKMLNFSFNENSQYTKINTIDILSSNQLKDEDNLIVFERPEEEKNNKEKEKKEEEEIKKPIKNYIPTKPIIKKEEIKQFIYDTTMNNINASSFKYAFRNLGNDIPAKKDYLLKVNPEFFPQIFKTDLDKDTLLDIIKCLKIVENEGQIIDYLKGISKISRIKLIIQLIPRKQKVELIELFEKLEKGEYGSEVIAIKDFFLN